MDCYDTIAAIATPIGIGGVAVIRVSGPNSIKIVDKCFHPSSKKLDFFSSPTHRIYHGHIREEKKFIDEVLVSIFRNPHSYTGEDCVEINCHGGLVVVQQVLTIVLSAGARLAEPGEFTKRAFLNGKIDLTQAEAVVDLIEAKTERAVRAASDQLSGGLSRAIGKIRDELLQTLAHVEAYIDFPDEDISPDINDRLRDRLILAREHIVSMLETFREGYILRNGVRIAIAGRPNAGKSSLLNLLLKNDRAIVSDVPGTTRDTIEAEADIRGIPVIFIDTAGLRESEDIIEAEGVRRSLEWIEKADLTLWLADGSIPFSNEDREFLRRNGRENKVLFVLNKKDLGISVNLREIKDVEDVVSISCQTGEGVEMLKNLICARIGAACYSYEQGIGMINTRHHNCLLKAKEAIDESLHFLSSGSSFIEFLASELHIAVNSTSELLGKTTTEDLLDSIFNQFCIGK